MTKTQFLGLLVPLAMAAPLPAQEAAAPSAAKSPRIAVIDMQRVSSESLLGKEYASRLEALQNEINSEGTKKQAELQKLDAALKALQEELEKQGSVLSEEAREKKRQEIVRKTRERQAFLEDGQAELARMRERAQQQAQTINSEFQIRIRPVVEEVARQQGIDLVFTSEVAYTINRDYDITRDVIVKADDVHKAAAAGAAKPQAATPPSP
jgi:outer membrane protein